MAFLAAEIEGESERIQWLIRLRWVAVLGVLGVLTVAGPAAGLVPHPLPLFVLVGLLAVWNLVLAIRTRRGAEVQSAGQQVAIDLFVLATLLFLSGGLRNPFSIFLVVQVILGAILIPPRTALRVGLFGAGLTLLLAAAEVLHLLPSGTDYAAEFSGDLAVWGIALALLITAGFAMRFTITIMEDLRARALEAARYHEEAERERQRVFDVVRFVGAPLVLLDQHLDVDWQNRRAEQVLGPWVRGQPFRLPDGEAWPTSKDLTDRHPVEREWKGKDRQGRPRVFHLSASPLFNQRGDLEQVILVFTDITDRRAAELQLHHTEKLSALGRLAAGVAHEINTPLGSVLILASEAQKLVERSVAGDGAPQELVEHLSDIRQETERISTLVRRLLELSHPGPDRIEPIDLAELTDDAIRLITMRSSASRDRLRSTFAPETPVVRSSPDRLRQVLLNVLDNAIDATRRNQGAILVRTGKRGDSAWIEVEDHGEGITSENLPRVFDPFFTTKDVGEGTGLGLYVSYQIMKNLGGDIGIESRPGEGTRVHLSLPLEPLPPAGES